MDKLKQSQNDAGGEKKVLSHKLYLNSNFFQIISLNQGICSNVAIDIVFSAHPYLTQQAHVGQAGVSPSAPVLRRGHQHGLCCPGAIQVGSAVGEGDAVV